jgi:hypothetical protein
MTITLTREEAQSVLDAVENIPHFHNAVIETLRSRLSAPEPEEKKYTEESCPVCGYYCLGKGGVNCIDKPKLCGINNTPPQRKEPDPVADKYLMEIECTKCGAKQDGILTVNTPPQRKWQGLTDEEISITWNESPRIDRWVNAFARDIEAKLKEKNHV